MGLSRRELLAGVGIGLAVGAVGGNLNADLAPTPKRGGGAADWPAIRKDFLLRRDRVHLALLLLASHPKPVRDAIERHRRGFDENPVGYFRDNNDREEEAVREAAARYCGTGAAEMALTDSTTMGLAILYGGLKVRADQELLTSTHDHRATHESLALRSERTGAKLRKVTLYANGAAATEAEMVGNLSAALGPSTRVVALTWVHSSTGVRLPIRAMADVIEKANRGRSEADRILFCVDGVHGFGIGDVSLPELGCDFFSAGTHKWIFGPRGTGILWGRPSVASQLDGVIPSFSDKSTWAKRITPGGFHSFEHRWALRHAFDYHLGIGKAAIEKRIHALNRQFKEGARKMAKVRLHTPASDALSAGIVCFEVDGLTPDAVVARFAAKHVIASTTPYATSYARVTPGILNTPADVERALAVLKSI